jgi:multidrug resistance efflux pump
MEEEQDQREGARYADRTAAPAAPADRESVLDQIDRLDQLRQRGVISQAEFETKKAQLLERL